MQKDISINWSFERESLNTGLCCSVMQAMDERANPARARYLLALRAAFVRLDRS